MPSAADLGIVSGGAVDQSGLINTALANPDYAGIVFDFSPPGFVYISNSINGQNKVLRFEPGSYLSGPTGSTPVASVTAFVLDCGLRQQCFDPQAALSFNPIGTTLGKISPWVFGAVADDITDDAPAIQKTIDLIIANVGVQTLFIPSGTYKCNSPLICAYSLGTSYALFQISIEGEANFWEASGYGTVLDFRGINDTFGIGLHQTKGASIKRIKLWGAWNYTFPDAYTFYNTSLGAFTDGVCRDETYSPYAGIVIDPFGPSVPADGGYPGLSAYYYGSDGGSTGVTLEDVFITNFVIGYITSPNGQTFNAELMRAEKIQFSNMKICIAGCQSQEKMNVFRHLGIWGVCHTIFLAGTGGGAAYGANSAGNWYVEDVNLAGYNNQFVYLNSQGYFPSYFKNIYAESLGQFGTINTQVGGTVESSNFDFANYEDAGSYQTQIEANISFIGCNLRMYGTGRPVTILNSSWGPYFNSCSFETVPLFNLGGHRGSAVFENCSVGDAGIIMGPPSSLSLYNYSDSFAYGNIKITTRGITFDYNSPFPAAPMPVNRSTANYAISKTLVGGYYQATVTCSGDELDRVFVGDVIAGDTTADNQNLQVIGIVSAVGSGSFTINYIPAWVVTGNYYLYIWLPLYNVAFIGDTTYGSNQITNVGVVVGDLPTVLSKGGLLSTTSVQVSDAWQSGLIRLLGYDATSGTLTFDKTAIATATSNLFTNTNAAPNTLFPSIAAGPGAGSSAVAAITKLNYNTMQISVTTGTTPSASAIVASISFGLPFAGGYVPSPRFSPANAAALGGASQVFMDADSSTGFTITSGPSALTASTLYLWNVQVG